MVYIQCCYQHSGFILPFASALLDVLACASEDFALIAWNYELSVLLRDPIISFMCSLKHESFQYVL